MRSTWAGLLKSGSANCSSFTVVSQLSVLMYREGKSFVFFVKTDASIIIGALFFGWRQRSTNPRLAETSFPPSPKTRVLFLFLFSWSLCTAASVKRLFWDAESKIARRYMISSWTLTGTIGVWRKISCVLSSCVRAAVILRSIVVCSAILLEAPDVTFSCSPALALRLFPNDFFTWLLIWCAASRCNKVWCSRPHLRHEKPSQFSARCPGRRQLTQSPLILISCARSLTPRNLNYPHLKIRCSSSQHLHCWFVVVTWVWRCLCPWFCCERDRFSIFDELLLGAADSKAWTRSSRKVLSSW